ncbi:ATP-binding protein [Sorangium sp. So ce302]|uniref:AAA family ATPase n=1 Tax=Sorangium sp. So ce302 TaxID=3133297 RepID=UPI003F610AC4
MITSVRLQEFKGHRDSTVALGRLTVLVGPNGSGKTSVLEALALQSRLVRYAPRDVLTGDWSPGDLLRRGTKGGAIALTSRGTWEDEDWSFRTAFSGSEVDVEWKWKRSGDLQKVTAYGDHPLRSIVPRLDEAVAPATLYKLNAERIAAAAYSDDLAPGVDYDGANTAVALAAIKLGYDEAFERIEESLRRIIPNVERVRIRQAKVGRPNPELPHKAEDVVGSKVFFDFRGAPSVPAHAASEGTLITLALLTVLHGPNRPEVLLLDDFAESLHPQAQMDLVRLVRRLLEEFSDLQVVATTHSPYILDELDPSEIYAFALRDDGTVALKRLSEHPQATEVKGTLSAGQLWSMDPERDWVLAESAP